MFEFPSLRKDKRWDIAQVLANVTVLALEEELSSMFWSSRVITFHFDGGPQ